MKYIPVMLLLLLASCVSAGPFKQDLGGARAVIQSVSGEARINVSRQVDLSENSTVGTLKPGESVKILKKTDKAALVQLDNGNTGWIDIKFIKNSQ